jgi:NADH-quinone oxidoreductase subunit C
VNPDELKAALERDHGKSLASVTVTAQKELVAVAQPGSYIELCRSLRDTPAYGFEHLSCLTAVDYPAANKITVVCHLWSYRHRTQMTLKLDTDRANPKAPTLEGVWKSADWFEREVFDLYGVVFEGHPDLRRIMMPDDYQKHPLRKDFTDDGFIVKPN